MLVIKLLDKVLVQNIGGRFPTVLTMRKSQPFNKKLMFTVFYSLLKQLLNLMNITIRIWGFIRGGRYVSCWSVITWTAYRLCYDSLHPSGCIGRGLGCMRDGTCGRCWEIFKLQYAVGSSWYACAVRVLGLRDNLLVFYQKNCLLENRLQSNMARQPALEGGVSAVCLETRKA